MADGFTAEERLLVLMSFARLDEAEKAEARTAAAGVRDWDAFVTLAEDNATAPLVAYNLAALGLDAMLPAPARARLDERTAAIKAQNEARLAVGRTLLARLAERGVPVVILKGVLFAETLYGNPYYKKMNDIDILIRREDLDTIYAVYEELGFFSAAELVGGSPRKQEKFSHHAPPFFSRDLACMLGTHWGLITPLAPYKLDYDAIWSRVRDLDFQGVPAKQMAPEDNLHHLCVHLPYYKTGVRELADIYNLVRHYEADLDWGLFHEEIRKAKTENLVYHALALANRLCPRADVATALDALRPRVSWYFARDTERKVARVGTLLRSRSVHMSVIEKAYAEFRATKSAAEKRRAFTRIIGGILYPPDADVAKLSSLDQPRPAEWIAARVAAPWRISRVFARDLGPAIYAAMLAKAAIEVCETSVRQTFSSPETKIDDYAAFAAKIGVSPADLQRLKDHLE